MRVEPGEEKVVLKQGQHLGDTLGDEHVSCWRSKPEHSSSITSFPGFLTDGFSKSNVKDISSEQKCAVESGSRTQNPSFPEVGAPERFEPRVHAMALGALTATASAARMAAQAAPL
ncbi:hypothetical protein Cadr_000000210 [Camelus dromedarius]|uniref:Uncharacterized protein n=1 Tax=Camelus dromedarius TaxID=9838 RepID=A0A5N4EK94_CAMDR|nr:hypothetical protein Cadr_000000210 [Camelus dromedarius]